MYVCVEFPFQEGAVCVAKEKAKGFERKKKDTLKAKISRDLVDKKKKKVAG